jgi:hypothetical protein
MFPYAYESLRALLSWGERRRAKARRRSERNLHLPLRVLQLEDRLTPAAVSWTGGAGTLNSSLTL